MQYGKINETFFQTANNSNPILLLLKNCERRTIFIKPHTPYERLWKPTGSNPSHCRKPEMYV
jgi:hypothetical protein